MLLSSSLTYVYICSGLEALTTSVNALTLLVETRLPILSKSGSTLSNDDLATRFSFGRVPLNVFRWDRKGIRPKIACVCFMHVYRYAVRMARQFRRGAIGEIQIVQPATRLLLRQLCLLLLGRDAVLRFEVEYKASEVHIHGRMDSGVFMAESNMCVLSDEDKRMDEKLKDCDICQAGGELAASVEMLRNFGINPLIFNSLLNSGREWILLRRVLLNSRPIWQYSSSLYLFNQEGDVDVDSVYLLTRILMHCFSNTRDLIDQAKQPLQIGYGNEMCSDDEWGDDNDFDEEDDEDRDKTENYTAKKQNTKALKTATGSAVANKAKGTSGISGSKRRASITRKFGAALTHENLHLFERTSRYEL